MNRMVSKVYNLMYKSSDLRSSKDCSYHCGNLNLTKQTHSHEDYELHNILTLFRFTNLNLDYL